MGGGNRVCRGDNHKVEAPLIASNYGFVLEGTMEILGPGRWGRLVAADKSQSKLGVKNDAAKCEQLG